MARAARRDVAALRLRARSMTTIAGYVSVEARWDRQSHTSVRRPVTSDAGNTLHTHVQRVIEFHSEAL